MRYKINGRITQSGRRTIEQGLYRWLQSRGASNIKINSVLETSSRSGSGLVASAGILQLSDVLADNSTVVDTTAAEEQPLSATELAAGAAALDAAIAEDEAQPRDEPLGTGVTIASTRQSTRRYCSAVSAAGGGGGMGRAQERDLWGFALWALTGAGGTVFQCQPRLELGEVTLASTRRYCSAVSAAGKGSCKVYLQGLVSVGGFGEGGHCQVGRLGRGVRWWIVLSVLKGAVVTVFWIWPTAEKSDSAASTRDFRSVLAQQTGRSSSLLGGVLCGGLHVYFWCV
jgi:hypothetical protein